MSLIQNQWDLSDCQRLCCKMLEAQGGIGTNNHQHGQFYNIYIYILYNVIYYILTISLNTNKQINSNIHTLMPAGGSF